LKKINLISIFLSVIVLVKIATILFLSYDLAKLDSEIAHIYLYNIFVFPIIPIIDLVITVLCIYSFRKQKISFVLLLLALSQIPLTLWNLLMSMVVVN